MSDLLTGGCLCGAVRFEAEAPPKWTAWCHCDSCRRHSGAPVSAYAGFEKEQVRFTKGAQRTYPSSLGVLRGFCEACGSSLSYVGDRWPTEIHLHIGAFDNPGAIPVIKQAFKEERLPWVHIAG